MPNDQLRSELCYLDAAHVNSPAGVHSELDVVTASGEQLGSITGVVIEAAAGRARYFDVRSSGGLRRRRYLVEADQLAQIDTDGKVLRLVSAGVREVYAEDVDPSALRHFDDDDLMAALFPPRAA